MMYEELVKMLHVCGDSNNSCWDCPILKDGSCPHEEWEFAAEKYMLQAADAIEELIAALTASNEVIAKSRPKWIPVTERLPDMKDYDYVLGIVNGSDINVRFENAVEMVSYDPGSGWFMDDYPNAEISVTHWMPLPEPPNEEK